MRTLPYRWVILSFGLSCVLALPEPGRSQAAPDTSVRLIVTLDHADWRYHVGDTARFEVSLLRAGRPIPSTFVRVAIAMERMRPLSQDSVEVSRGPRTLRGTLAVPGFLRATATAAVDGTVYTQLATAAYDPERISATTTMPADFEQFWQRAVEEARRVPLDPVLTLLPGRSTPDVNVYHVSFQNHRAGSRIYGMLSVPARPGKYPAILNVPGAGVRPYFPNVATAAKGVIYLSIGIHGIPVDRDSLLYNELRATALYQYWSFGADDRDSYYYKRVFVGAVRAGDFLFALPQFDGTHYVVEGGSQGGGLSLVLGALDPRVRAIAVSYPAMSDEWGYFAGHAGGWPHMFQDTTRMRGLADKKETIRYFDGVNFARLLRIPVIYAFGFNDTTVPPTSSYATYNAITAPKQLLIVKETGHFRAPSQTEAMNAWLLKQLGLP